MNKENDVILAVLKLSRAMRRCAPPPPPPGPPFPGNPADREGFPGPGHPCRPVGGSAGRLLACIAENPNVSSRDLCEILDLRPSSLSEMLARGMEAARKKDAERKTACFTEEEKAQFCALCNRLSEHLESLALDLPEQMPRPERPSRRPLPPEGRMKC